MARGFTPVESTSGTAIHGTGKPPWGSGMTMAGSASASSSLPLLMGRLVRCHGVQAAYTTSATSERPLGAVTSTSGNVAKPGSNPATVAGGVDRGGGVVGRDDEHDGLLGVEHPPACSDTTRSTWGSASGAFTARAASMSWRSWPAWRVAASSA